MFYLQHFKNFEKAEIDYEKPVTLLIGPNGAGKSNLIEAIELLSFIASGRPLHEVTDFGREGGLEVRGGLDACASHGFDIFTLGHRFNVPTPEGDREAHYEISIRAANEPRIAAEFLKISGRDIPVFEVLASDAESTSADNQVRYDNNAKGKNKPIASAAADRSALSQYARFALKNKKLSETLKVINAVDSALTAPSVFDPVPRLMRNYERDTETRLARNGFNLSTVLFWLCRQRMIRVENTKTKKWELKTVNQKHIADRILKRISQLPDEPFVEFDFIRTKARDVMFGFKTPHGNKTVTARILSDGTLRALAILTALETSPPGQRLILEEFDNGVHPSRVNILSEALFDCAVRNQLRVVATTQNPGTLNALTDEQYGSVLFVVHDAGQKFARLLPLTDLPGYVEFMEQGRLGDLVTRRIYEKHLRPDYEGDRKEEMERWLQTLP
jgi:ABC-type cobalamin/Fe3+-siderophores transport system ATPase subunit